MKIWLRLTPRGLLVEVVLLCGTGCWRHNGLRGWGWWASCEMVFYGESPAMSCGRIWYGIKIGHVNGSGCALAVCCWALSIVVIIEIIQATLALLMGMLILLIGLLLGWRLRHRRPLLILMTRLLPGWRLIHGLPLLVLLLMHLLRWCLRHRRPLLVLLLLLLLLLRLLSLITVALNPRSRRRPRGDVRR